MKVEKIRCPYCELQQEEELKYDEYWDGETCACERCAKVFKITEETIRHFMAEKTEGV